MKRIFFIFLTAIPGLIMAQKIDYEIRWKEIDQLSKEGNIKSLLPKINEIYSLAKKENNTSEIVNALIYQSQIIAQTKEDTEDELYKMAIHNFDKEISSFKGVTLPVMQSLLANIYQQYREQTRWSRYDITEAQTVSEDISTWTPNQLSDKSLQLYKESVKNKDLLKREDTKNWTKILTTNEDLNLRPTLYDVLVFRYINTLQDYSTEDSVRNKENKQTVKTLLTELQDFHKNDTDKSAYLNLRLEEINFSDQDQEGQSKEILKLAQAYSQESFSAYLYYVAADKIQYKDKIQAFTICNKASDDKGNPWAVNCKNLKEELQRQSLSVSINNVQLPGENLAVFVNAANLRKIYYRIYETRQITTLEIKESNSEILEAGIFGKEKKLVKSGMIELKPFDDYSSYSTIARLEGLPPGNYQIEIANTLDFKKLEKNKPYLLSSTYFAVHNWTLISLSNTKSYQLLDRNTGQVLKNQQIQLYKEKQYSDSISNIFSQVLTLKTDDQGIFEIPEDSKNRYNYYYLYQPKSKSYIKFTSVYFNYGSQEERENIQAVFFTDRSIFRPGQTVYFKSILYKTNKELSSIIKNKKVKVTLMNPNGEQVSTLDVTTSEYGSIFGEFILPQGGITGQYSLDSEYGRIYFSVEEYKRPKFEVTMDKLKGEYVLDKEVKTQGKAVSYAGAPISEAKVVYRVERQEVFLYFRWWFPPGYSTPETISQGETITDGNGNFNISFVAQSKDSRKDKEYRTYTYTIYADITDINGETRSVESQVTVGDLPKKLTLSLGEKITEKEFTQIGITSSNLNDIKEPSRGKIIITSLESPKKIIFPTYKNIPDYQLYSKEEFDQYFPYLPYSQEEQNPQFWKKRKSQTYDFDTQKAEEIKISGYKRGFYLVEAHTLFGKDSIKTQKIVEVTDPHTLKSTDNLFFDAFTTKKSYHTGENIEINFLSDIKEAVAVLHIESRNQWIEHKEIPIKNGKGIFTLPAKKEYLKEGLFVSAFLVKENGYGQKKFQISITDKPRDLKITTKVFRDKIEPGVKETWELTISGNDKDKITAEVLASLYDASLDQFQSNSYTFNPWGYQPYGYLYRQLQLLGYREDPLYFNVYYDYQKYKTPVIADLKDFKLYSLSRNNIVLENSIQAMPAPAESGMASALGKFKEKNDALALEDSDMRQEREKPKKEKDMASVQVRTNLQETAFFYPSLYTDKEGNIKLTFTSPEALTKWKLLILTHTQDLQVGTAEFYTQTQKDLMVVPNVPRFLREGDKITISTKINNFSKKELSGNAQLLLFDAITNKPVDAVFSNISSMQPFNIGAHENTEARWVIQVPDNIQAVTCRIVAKAGNFSDGEENILPVLTNRMLVTETLPISIKENQTKEYRLDKLADAKSNSLKNFNLSLEMTTNPTWLAVFSLPYLREYPYDCSEQLFSRLYGNILSAYIVNSSPKIKKVFDNWNVQEINASSLERNQELKNILLEETPWIREAQSESAQKKRMAVLFDLNNKSQENEQAQDKLLKRQNPDGGFSWFEGGKSSPYITERIILGFGQLKTMLGDKAEGYLNQNVNTLIKNAIDYTDQQTLRYIKEQKKNKGKVDGKNLTHYFYVRSFWKDTHRLPAEITKYLADINKDIPSYFRAYDLQNKAMIALVLHRYGYNKSAQTIIHNMKETSVEADEMGMYWKDNKPGWFWYQTPVESQTRAIEAFAEITPKDVQAVEEMKVWLLKNRQTNSWNSTKATTDAVYALMTFGKDWSNAEDKVKIFVGNQQFYPSENINTEQAAGYIKESWKGSEITPDKGMIRIEKASPGVAWGGLYWQYFEDLNKITQADTHIKMQKQLFLKANTDKGQQLQEITNTKAIRVGDLITVRLVIKTDRDMEYIHIKDMRASGFEPVNVLSGYKYQNGAGYYESTRDAATNFFFEHLSKGTYVFEYDVRANNPGEFSNGITQLQSMYAPEMSAHSEGVRISIK